MSAWTDDELSRIGGAEELQLSSARGDGSLRPYVTMWVVRAGDEPYVRRHGPRIVGTVVGPRAAAVTVRLVPRPG